MRTANGNDALAWVNRKGENVPTFPMVKRIVFLDGRIRRIIRKKEKYL